jgi:hypothetical protein
MKYDAIIRCLNRVYGITGLFYIYSRRWKGELNYIQINQQHSF